MASGGDPSPFTFVEQAKYWFKNSYPNWKDTFNASPYEETETICIPDALDVLPNRRLENYQSIMKEIATDEAAESSITNQDQKKAKQAYKRDISGQKGEDQFFEAFRRLKLGGILILGFDTQEFIMKMCKEEVSDFDYRVWKEDKRHFECDAIFIHHQLGVYIIETKGCENRQVATRFNKAAQQLKRSIERMSEIYSKITGINCSLEFCGVICIPNADVSLIHNTYRVLGKREIESKNFRQFWFLNEVQLKQKTLKQRFCELISEHLCTFLATIIGYRSAKFLSLPSNVLEIYRIIEQQDFRRAKKQKMSSACEFPNQSSMKAESIILNREQLQAVECMEQRLIISGPPGTGKTIIMLLRALAAAKLDKLGRVVIMAGEAEFFLESLFRKFIADNQDETFKREIIVKSFSAMQGNNLDALDDLFIDEIAVDEWVMSVIFKEQMERLINSASTTIVMTGKYTPDHVADDDMAEMLDEHFHGFHHIQLRTVIRGTLSIIEQWKRFFPKEFCRLGHNVEGAPVERFDISHRYSLLKTVEQKVLSLLNRGGMTDDDNFHCAPHHIAVLVSDERIYLKPHETLIAEIKGHLRSKKISCGDFDEQINDRNLLAVGDPIHSISLEWPIVIYIYDDFYDENLIALSRCISKLYVIRTQIT